MLCGLEVRSPWPRLARGVLVGGGPGVPLGIQRGGHCGGHRGGVLPCHGRFELAQLLGFGIQGSKFRVCGLGFDVWGLGCKGRSSRFVGWGLWIGV